MEYKNPVKGYSRTNANEEWKFGCIFEGSPRDIAAFILLQENKQVLVTDMLDLPVIEIAGCDYDKAQPGGSYLRLANAVKHELAAFFCQA